MRAKIPLYSRLLAGAVAAIATAATPAIAETQPWDAPHARAIPMATRLALATLKPAQRHASASLGGLPARDAPALPYDATLHGANREPAGHLDSVPNSCARNGGGLCYDYRSGHAVYKPMRSLLPHIPGMTPQNLVIHRNRIVAKYTFK